MVSDEINKRMQNLWKIGPVDKATANQWVNHNLSTLVWKRFRFWQKQLGLRRNLDSIEAGCGYGKFSMGLGLFGADVTLLDYNEESLKIAVDTHKLISLNPEWIVSDLLNLDPSLFDRYDMVCSFGTLEHFQGKSREEAFQSYVNLVKSGGLIFFTVPNKHGYIYRIMFGLRRLLGLVSKEFFEDPYSIRELEKIARSNGVKILEINGIGTLKADFNYWVMENIKSLIRKITGKVKKKENILNEVTNYEKLNFDAKHPAPRNFFDKRFSASLLFVGQKI